MKILDLTLNLHIFDEHPGLGSSHDTLCDTDSSFRTFKHSSAKQLWLGVFVHVHMTDCTYIATPPKTTESRTSISSVQSQFVEIESQASRYLAVQTTCSVSFIRDESCHT